MNVTLPRQLEERLTPREAGLHLAIGLFVDEEATLGQAAEVAGMTQADFLRELGRRRIPIGHYGHPTSNPESLQHGVCIFRHTDSGCAYHLL